MYFTRSEYVAEMRRIEMMRNEALRLHDRSALAIIHQSEVNVNRTFWGREPKTPR